MIDRELSIVILARNEGDNLMVLIPRILSEVKKINTQYEVVVVDGNSSDNTAKVARSKGCRVISQDRPGYGNAFRQAFREVRGRYVINIDADCSHDPELISNLWSKRGTNQLVIASRYIKGGKAEMAVSRMLLSIILNRAYSFFLSLPYRDLSSGYRMYKVEPVRSLIDSIKADDFDILLDILIKLHCYGYKITEIPFCYKPRKHGKSTVRLFKFGLSYVKTLLYSWQLRNSAFSADYDDRAFNSIIPLQRYWQRKRYEIVMNMNKGNERCVDLGCGSSKIIQHLPHSVGLDLDMKKLRFIQKNNRLLVKGDIGKLPLTNGSFSSIICSQIIEHVPKENFKIRELHRILKKDGTLILGTPDYSTFWWNFFEWFYIKLLPNAYGEGHIAHYDRMEMRKMLEENGFKVVDYKYVWRAELIMKAVKLMDTVDEKNK